MKKLRFNNRIYKKEAIQEAISVYSHLAKFSLAQSKSYFEVRMEKMSADVKNIIADEFANYVLGETKKCF